MENVMEHNNSDGEAERLLRETWARYVDSELIPVADGIDEKDEFPREVFKRIADMGAYGIRYPDLGT